MLYNIIYNNTVAYIQLVACRRATSSAQLGKLQCWHFPLKRLLRLSSEIFVKNREKGMCTLGDRGSISWPIVRNVF